MEISEKSKSMAFLGQYPVSCKIVVDNKCLQQVKNCKYLSEIPMKMILSKN